MKQTLINYTTEIDVEKTVKEIRDLLFDKEARNIWIERNNNNEPKTIHFSFPFPGVPDQFINYSISANWEGCLAAMKKKTDVAPRYQTVAQAKRTVWRTIKYWIEMQIGMTEIAQGNIERMFFSMAVDSKTGNYVVNDVIEFKVKQLTAGN